ncbi:MAG: hypothetical protein ACREJP_00355 [Candidatus Methylomirabilales bacterium]
MRRPQGVILAPPGTAATDPEIVQLRGELERSNEALKELAIENTLLRGKVNGV